MSIYPNTTEQNIANQFKLAERQKNQPAEKTKNRFLKQTHDLQLAETFMSIIKKITEVRDYTNE